MQHSCKIAISLPKDNFQKIEQMRHKMGIGRSAVIDKAICFWLEWVEQEELIKRYEEGYRKKPEKVVDLRAFEKAQLEVLSLEEWS